MHTQHGLPSFLCMWISSFNKSICWRDCPFPVEYPWHPCSKTSIDYIHKGLFLNLFSIPLVYISVFRPEPHCFDDCTFVVNFEIRKCESSKFAHLFQDRSGYLGVLESPYDSYNVFDYICKKKNVTGVWQVFVIFIECFGHYWHLNMIKSSNPWTWYLFPFIYVFLNSFQHFLL